jgi:hypothetical protein
LRALIGGKINQATIERNWPDILRIAATIAAGSIAPSQILRKLASYPWQNELAAALRQVCRVERTLFMIDWILMPICSVALNRAQQGRGPSRPEAGYQFPSSRRNPDRSAEGQYSGSPA